MTKPFTYDVFLSHSAKDKDIVIALADRLTKDGLRIWLDNWEIQPGDNIPSKLELGLENSRVLVLCMSENTLGNDWVEREYGHFLYPDPLNKERRFIALRLDEAPIRSSLIQFRHINWLPSSRDEEYPKLLDACRGSVKSLLAEGETLRPRGFTALSGELPNPEFAPPRPYLFYGRETDMETIKQRLGCQGGAPQALTVVRGWPGVGKTTLAVALASDHSVVSAFSARLPLWASLGPEPDLFSKLDKWARTLGVSDLRKEHSLQEASDRVRGILLENQTKVLLFIDDAWETMHAKALMVGGPNCATVITTRKTKVAESLASPDDIFVLDGLAAVPSLKLLAKLAPAVVQSHPQECIALVQDLQGLPLALHVAGKMLNRNFGRWSDVTRLLKELRSGVPLLPEDAPQDLVDLKGRSPTVLALLKRSIDLLDEQTQERFALLGHVAEKPATFNVKYLRSQWQTKDPRPTVDVLVDSGLLEPVGNQRFMMHALLIAVAKWMLMTLG